MKAAAFNVAPDSTIMRNINDLNSNLQNIERHMGNRNHEVRPDNFQAGNQHDLGQPNEEVSQPDPAQLKKEQAREERAQWKQKMKEERQQMKHDMQRRKQQVKKQDHYVEINNQPVTELKPQPSPGRPKEFVINKSSPLKKNILKSARQNSASRA